VTAGGSPADVAASRRDQQASGPFGFAQGRLCDPQNCVSAFNARPQEAGGRFARLVQDHTVSAPAKRSLVILAFAAVYLIWGSTYLGILFAIQSIPPLLMAGSRFLLAGIIMYGIARAQGAPHPGLTTWKGAAIVGGCLLLGGNGGVTISEKWVPSGLAALLVAIIPIYMALLSWMTGIAPRPRPIVWAGLIAGLAGVGLLAGPAFTAPAGSNHLGLGISILLVGSFLWAAGSLYSRTAAHSTSLILTAGQQMICGGALLLLAGFALGEQRGFAPEQVTRLSIIAFVYLVLIGALVGYTAYFYLLRHCDPAKVATYAYVNPVVAILLGTIFAHEHLTGRTLLGAGLVIGSVAFVISAQQFMPREVEAIPGGFAEAEELP
jgi:drug/metabolite transporter (DMT)-like permease